MPGYISEEEELSQTALTPPVIAPMVTPQYLPKSLQDSEPVVDDYIPQIISKTAKPKKSESTWSTQVGIFNARSTLAQANTATTPERMPAEEDIQNANKYLAKYDKERSWWQKYGTDAPSMISGSLVGGIKGRGAVEEALVLGGVGAATAGTAGLTSAAVGALSGPLAVITVPLTYLGTTLMAGTFYYEGYGKLREPEFKEGTSPTWGEIAESSVESLKYGPVTALAGAAGAGARSAFKSGAKSGAKGASAGFSKSAYNQMRNWFKDPKEYQSASTKFKTDTDIMVRDVGFENGYTPDPSPSTIVKQAIGKPSAISLTTETTMPTYQLGDTAKELLASGAGKATMTDVSAAGGFDIVANIKTGKYTYSQDSALKNPIEANVELENTHKTMLDAQPDLMAKTRYLYSQMANLASTSKAWVSELQNTVWKDIPMGNHEIRQYDMIFGDEEFDNILGDAIYLGKEITNVPQHLEDLFQSQGMATKKNPNLQYLAKKYLNNYNDYQKKVQKILHGMGVEVSNEDMGNFLPQYHDAARVNQAGPIKWRDDILPLLDVEKTFANPWNKQVEGKTIELEKKITELEKKLKTQEETTATNEEIAKAEITELKQWNQLSAEQQLAFQKRFLTGSGKIKKNGRVSEGAFGTIARRDGQLDGSSVGSGPKTWKEKRVLHFKDQASRKEYMKQYSKVNPLVMTSVTDYVNRQGKSLAVHNAFGSNPNQMIDTLRNHIEATSPKAGVLPDLVSFSLSKMTEIQQKALFGTAGSTFWSKHPLGGILWNAFNDGSANAKTRGSWSWSIAQEPTMAFFVEGMFKGYSPNNIPKILKNYYTKAPNGRAMQRIGAIARQMRYFDDLGNNDIQNFKDKTSVKVALKYRNAMRLSNPGRMLSDHNEGVTRAQQQFNLAELVHLNENAAGLSDKHRRILKLCGITDVEFDLTKKYQKHFLTDISFDEYWSKFAPDSYSMLWQQALSNIASDDSLSPGIRKRLNNIARKWGNAEQKLVDRTMLHGDSISAAFITGGDHGFAGTFFKNSLPFRGWLWKEIMIGIENFDFRTKGDWLQATGAFMLQRLMIGAAVTALKEAARGRHYRFKDEDSGELNTDAIKSFLFKSATNGGMGSIGSDIAHNMLQQGWRDWKRTLKDMAMIGGMGPSLAVEKTLLIGDAIYKASEGEAGKALKSAANAIPFANSDFSAVLMHRLILDTWFTNISPEYYTTLDKEAKLREKFNTPYFDFAKPKG